MLIILDPLVSSRLIKSSKSLKVREHSKSKWTETLMPPSLVWIYVDKTTNLPKGDGKLVDAAPDKTILIPSI